MWKQATDLTSLNARNAGTINEVLGIVFTEVGEDYIVGTMPVSEKTVQPYRILHGGANVVLAESLGSIASTLCLDDWTTQVAVGIEVNANHLKSVREGSTVTATCRPIRVGRTLHVWQIEIRDEKGDLSCISRLTVSIVARR